MCLPHRYNSDCSDATLPPCVLTVRQGPPERTLTSRSPAYGNTSLSRNQQMYLQSTVVSQLSQQGSKYRGQSRDDPDRSSPSAGCPQAMPHMRTILRPGLRCRSPYEEGQTVLGTDRRQDLLQPDVTVDLRACGRVGTEDIQEGYHPAETGTQVKAVLEDS